MYTLFTQTQTPPSGTLVLTDAYINSPQWWSKPVVRGMMSLPPSHRLFPSGSPLRWDQGSC